MHPNIHSTYSKQDVKTTEMPTDGVGEEDVTYVYNRRLLSHNKERNAICRKLAGTKNDHTK